VNTWVIVVAGGSGSRFSGELHNRPKQFLPFGGRVMLDWSIEVAASVASGVVVVVPEAHVSAVNAQAVESAVVNFGITTYVVPGGRTRSESVRAGLAVVPPTANTIVIHDAARPLATKALFDAVIEAVDAGADGAIPGLAVTDTIKRVEAITQAGALVTETVERDHLVAVQTPQAFRADALRRAHAGDPDASDDAGLVEKMGGRVVVVPGETRNLKITRPDDLIMAEMWLTNE
jgi:2-C-methyl-D-erythritol 4-phosphate cytidylyltransferase